ncbi:MAG: ribosome maturation factor RimM [bacterium]|nr:ribosome maturation factor RimM [bacterium]
MREIYIGRIVSTHGIKGEIKIISDFEYNDKVFVVGKRLIIDHKQYEIKSYRKHKQFDMVTLDDYKDINEVLFLMKKKVYMLEDEIELGNLVLDQDLLNYSVLTVDGKCGIIKEIFFGSPNNKLLRVMFDKEIIIPFNSPMIKEISKERKEVVVELIEGM